MTWNPLHSSLLTSSLLAEGPDVVAVWALLVASADRYGESDLTAPVVASLLRISTERAVAAFAILAAPDPHSRTRHHEGRRIVPSEGGTWFLPSHAKHRALMAKEKARERQERYRDRLKAAERALCGVEECEATAWATTAAGVPVCSKHVFAVPETPDPSREKGDVTERDTASRADGEPATQDDRSVCERHETAVVRAGEVPFTVPAGGPGEDAAFADHDEDEEPAITWCRAVACANPATADGFCPVHADEVVAGGRP